MGEINIIWLPEPNYPAVFWHSLLTAGPIVVEVPVSRLGEPSLTQWTAVLKQNVPNPTGPRALSVSLSSPASASIGVYTLQMRVEACLSVKTHSLGQFTLLCNPWCQGECYRLLVGRLQITVILAWCFVVWLIANPNHNTLSLIA